MEGGPEGPPFLYWNSVPFFLSEKKEAERLNFACKIPPAANCGAGGSLSTICLTLGAGPFFFTQSARSACTRRGPRGGFGAPSSRGHPFHASRQSGVQAHPRRGRHHARPLLVRRRQPHLSRSSRAGRSHPTVRPASRGRGQRRAQHPQSGPQGEPHDRDRQRRARAHRHAATEKRRHRHDASHRRRTLDHSEASHRRAPAADAARGF